MTAGLATAVGLAAVALLLGGWLGYPFMLMALGRKHRESGQSAASSPTSEWPPVSLILATREHPAIVHRRLNDLPGTSYPVDRLTVVIAVDARSPHPLPSHAPPPGFPIPVAVVAGDPPGGKATALNAGVRAATTDLIIFLDSAQEFAPDAVGELVRSLLVVGTGAATGAIATPAERGVFQLFWRYERALRARESALGSVVAVTGAIYGIHRMAWTPLPPGLICDDLLVPLHIRRSGLGVVENPAALAHDPRHFTRDQQLGRKVRTLTGMLQLCSWEPWVLSPRRNPNWLPFTCHKLLRVATPLLIAIAGTAGLLLLPPRVTLWLALAGSLTLVVGASFATGSPRRGLRECYWALRLVLAPFTAMSHALRRDWEVWKQGSPPPIDQGTGR